MIDRNQWQRKQRRHWKRYVLLVIIIGSLSYGGWWLYGYLKKDATVITSTGGSTIPRADPILRITEWGVALRLDDYTADTSYEFISTSSQFVALSNSQLTAIAREYQQCNNVNTAVKLVRAKPGDTIYGQVQTEAALTEKGISIGDYFYYINQGEGCEPGFANTEVTNNVKSIQTRLSELYITTIPD